MDTQGGRYSIKIAGQRYTGRGKATIKPSQIGVKADANRDGTGFRTVEAKLASIDLTFDRGPASDRFRWTQALLLKSVDVTFTEDDAGITHYFTAGSWNGEPAIDTDSGEVSGMSVMSDQYSSR